MSTILLDASRGARLLSGEYDYTNESGSSFYYSDSQGVSSTSNLGTVAEGETLRRRAPSWVISAGQSNLSQTTAADTDDQEVEALHVVGEAGEPDFSEGWAIHTVGDPGEPDFTNSWSGNSPCAFFYTVGDGTVSVALDVTHSGATTAAIFTLPATWRPAVQEVDGDITVNTNGTVVPSSSLDAVNAEAVFSLATAPDTDEAAYTQDADHPASFFKDPFGIVHLQGRVNPESGVVASSAFTLPEGYRPPFDMSLLGGNLDVLSDGSVVPDGVLLDGATFRAA